MSKETTKEMILVLAGSESRCVRSFTAFDYGRTDFEQKSSVDE